MSQITTKRHHVTREEEADRDLNGTQFSKGSALWVALFFLLFVFGVPVAQHVVEIRQNIANAKSIDPKVGGPKAPIAPKIYEVFDLLPTGKQLSEAKGFWGYWGLIPSTESIGAFEEELKQSSILTQALLSPAQSVLTGALGVGNEKAYCGRPGWLFYRPDVEYLTSEGFLDPKVLTSRIHQGTAQPDPVKAILDFKKQLEARNIDLVVVPMPTKPMIEPEMLVGDSAKGEAPQNPSYPAFMQQLQSAGVKVYDPTELLRQRKTQSGTNQYLETDTHWTPEAMGAVAQDLSGFVTKNCSLSPGNDGYDAVPTPVSNLGDIAVMLKLPKDQTIYKPQTVTTEKINHGAESWSSDPAADVLVLGDSFTNIYSEPGLNWGEASGFAEHLSKDLDRPVDKIAINSGGSIATRRDLARQMHQGDRLAGKKVVIWEFSMRDLSQGDWRIIEMPKPPQPVKIPDQVKPSPTPAKSATELKVLSVTPAAFDPSKGESVTIRLSIPKGHWSAVIKNALGVTVQSFPATDAAADGPVEVKWSGKQDGKAVASGSYGFTLVGVGVAADPVDILVTGAEAKTAGIGAKPGTIDTVADQKTVADFNVPLAGLYIAEVFDAKGKRIRAIGRGRGGPGVMHVPWDGKDWQGKPAVDGKYKVRLSPAKATLSVDNAEVTVTVKSAVKGAAPTPPKTGGSTPAPTPVAEELVVTGKIASRGQTPQAGAYKDAVLALHLKDFSVKGGKIGNADILVYVWGMRDNKPVDGAYQVGSTVTLRLTPWNKAQGKYGSYNRLELDDDDQYSWPTFWGEVK